MKSIAIQSWTFNPELKDKFARIDEWRDEPSISDVPGDVMNKPRKIIVKSLRVLIRHVEPDKLHFNDVSDNTNYSLSLASFTSGRYTLHVWDQEPTPYEMPQIEVHPFDKPEVELPTVEELTGGESLWITGNVPVIFKPEGGHGSITPGTLNS